MGKIYKIHVTLTISIPLLLIILLITDTVLAEKRILNKNKVDLDLSISTSYPQSNRVNRKLEVSIVAEYDKKYSFGDKTRIYSFPNSVPNKPFVYIFDISLNHVDEKSVMINVYLAYEKYGELIERKPTLLVKSGKESSLILEDDSFKIELNVKLKKLVLKLKNTP